MIFMIALTLLGIAAVIAGAAILVIDFHLLTALIGLAMIAGGLHTLNVVWKFYKQ